MRSLTLVLLFLISIQAVAHMGEDTQGSNGGVATQPSNNVVGSRQQQESPSHSIPLVDAKLFNKLRYRSPRVLFSSTGVPDAEAKGTMGHRARRRASRPLHRGEYSVCDSVSHWVDNKTKATDMSGNEVTVLPNFNIDNVVIKQYFFETTCRSSRSNTGSRAGSGGSSGCRGIDGRHWNSYCSNTHTYVRALTSFRSQVAWRYIRINTACVCVLSRKSWKQ